MALLPTPTNEKIGVLVKTTCVDFPGLVATSFFLKGCNLYCPYCYNTALVDFNTSSKMEFSTLQELFSHLEKRVGIISGLVISGGEPLLNPYTPIIIKKGKELGYKIKIDTNGTLPQKIEALLNDDDLCPDFIAMDIKTSLNRYATDICAHSSPHFGDVEYFSTNLQKSIKLISNLPTKNREFRTVLVPTLVNKEDINNIASFLPKDATWQFAQFQNKNCLNPSFNEITPYTEQEINELISYAKTLISNSSLR